jgi:hypothetical protein
VPVPLSVPVCVPVPVSGGGYWIWRSFPVKPLRLLPPGV